MACPGVSHDDLREAGDDAATLDAKLSSALARVAPADFQRVLRAKKLDAMKDGNMIAGWRILFSVDQRFRMSEIWGCVRRGASLLDKDEVRKVSGVHQDLG